MWICMLFALGTITGLCVPDFESTGIKAIVSQNQNILGVNGKMSNSSYTFFFFPSTVLWTSAVIFLQMTEVYMSSNSSVWLV